MDIATARGIVEEGAGTQFDPAAVDAFTRDHRRRARADRDRTSADGPAIVLIVDDDPFIRRLIATTLEDVSGFELRQAADGQEALELAAAEPPAIVFLDIDMPRLDGISACRELRATPRRAGRAS